MSKTLQVISPPTAPTLTRLTMLPEELVNTAGEVITKLVKTPLAITIQGNTMHFVRQGAIGKQIRELTDEEVAEYKKFSEIETTVEP